MRDSTVVVGEKVEKIPMSLSGRLMRWNYLIATSVFMFFSCNSYASSAASLRTFIATFTIDDGRIDGVAGSLQRELIDVDFRSDQALFRSDQALQNLSVTNLFVPAADVTSFRVSDFSFSIFTGPMGEVVNASLFSDNPFTEEFLQVGTGGIIYISPAGDLFSGTGSWEVRLASPTQVPLTGAWAFLAAALGFLGWIRLRRNVGRPVWKDSLPV